MCNNTGAEEYYSDVHTNPTFNQVNYYRIKLSSGEVSELRRVFVNSDGRLPLYIYPNPIESINDQLRVRVPNGFNIRVQGFLYTANGFPLGFFDRQTQRDEFILETGTLESGLYLIWLTDGQQIYSGKFIVGR